MRPAFVTLAALALTALSACGKQPAQETPTPAAQAPAAPAPGALTPEQQAQALAALPSPYNAADLANGKAKFAMCRSCHTIVPGAPHMTGPNLHGVFGRKVGAAEGFNFSDPVKAAGFTWDGPQLDQWLANPKTFLPGTKMTFVGLPNETDRRDLIAFLMVETNVPPPGGHVGP